MSISFLSFYSRPQTDNVNPLVPTAHKSARIAQISILKLEGILKKIPVIVAAMSR